MTKNNIYNGFLLYFWGFLLLFQVDVAMAKKHQVYGATLTLLFYLLYEIEDCFYTLFHKSFICPTIQLGVFDWLLAKK